ncbi:MAG TPA: hypothetical protein DCS93_35360 [Microscillaceae bacterium]|nr:hypothetical protein [Microscillaceae bacterium]
MSINHFKKVLLFTFICLYSFVSNAQNLEGTWYVLMSGFKAKVKASFNSNLSNQQQANNSKGTSKVKVYNSKLILKGNTLKTESYEAGALKDMHLTKFTTISKQQGIWRFIADTTNQKKFILYVNPQISPTGYFINIQEANEALKPPPFFLHMYTEKQMDAFQKAKPLRVMTKQDYKGYLQTLIDSKKALKKLNNPRLMFLLFLKPADDVYLYFIKKGYNPLADQPEAMIKTLYNKYKSDPAVEKLYQKAVFGR